MMNDITGREERRYPILSGGAVKTDFKSARVTRERKGLMRPPLHANGQDRVSWTNCSRRHLGGPADKLGSMLTALSVCTIGMYTPNPVTAAIHRLKVNQKQCRYTCPNPAHPHATSCEAGQLAKAGCTRLKIDHSRADGCWPIVKNWISPFD